MTGGSTHCHVKPAREIHLHIKKILSKGHLWMSAFEICQEQHQLERIPVARIARGMGLPFSLIMEMCLLLLEKGYRVNSCLQGF